MRSVRISLGDRTFCQKRPLCRVTHGAFHTGFHEALACSHLEDVGPGVMWQGMGRWQGGHPWPCV